MNSPIRIEVEIVARVWRGPDCLNEKPSRHADLKASAEASRVTSQSTDGAGRRDKDTARKVETMVTSILHDLAEVLPAKISRSVSP
jgi:hypothetical protein